MCSSDKSNQKITIAEFNKMALYFPIYLALEIGSYNEHGLDVDFIATGGDDKTYSALLNNSAQIGIADPLFAMFEGEVNPEGYGEIIGSFVSGIPLVAITFDSNIQIDKIEDFSQYTLGTFPQYSTIHTIISKLLKDQELKAYEPSDIISQFKNNEFKIAIVPIEYAFNVESLDARIVYDFRDLSKEYLFSGFTVASNLSQTNKENSFAFLSSVKVAMKYLSHHPSESLSIFKKIFPEIRDAEKVLNEYKKHWEKSLKVDRRGYLEAHKTWKEVYPGILKNHDLSFYRSSTKIDSILDTLNSRNMRKEYPFLEHELRKVIQQAQDGQKSLKLFGFWGAGGKSNIDSSDVKTIEHISQYKNNLDSTYSLGSDFKFILADMHGINNGYNVDNVNSYLKEVKELLDQKGIKTIYLSELWDKWDFSFEKVKDAVDSKPKDWWKSISIARQLEHKSNNNFTGDDVILGAQKYYVLRELEKPLLEKEFDDYIFFVYGDSVSQQILPTKPTLYLFTEKKGYSVLPWFK
jgi:ABC-type nitrate/sulfonate/bicarbonate transport system substrate-binding protein